MLAPVPVGSNEPGTGVANQPVARARAATAQAVKRPNFNRSTRSQRAAKVSS